MQLCLVHILGLKTTTDSGASKYFQANLIDWSYLRFLPFVIMVRKVLLTGTEKDFGTFEHDFFWFLHRHFIPILIFWSFIIGSQFAMEVSMGVCFFFIMEMDFWLPSTESSSGVDALSSLLHISCIYHRDNQKLVINRGEKSSNSTWTKILVRKKDLTKEKYTENAWQFNKFLPAQNTSLRTCLWSLHAKKKVIRSHSSFKRA